MAFKTINDNVEVKIGDKMLSAPVSYSVPETAEDILQLMSTEPGLKDVITNISYASNLRARAKVRQTLLSQEGGPEKAFEAMVKQIVKQRAAVGKPIDEAKAKELAKAALGLD